MAKNTKNYDFSSVYDSINNSKEKEFMGHVIYGQKRIFAYILAMVPNHSEAEDILQDTLTIMWRKFDEFERGSNFVAWGIAIAKYGILKYRRSTNAPKLQLDDDVLGLVEKQSGGMFEKLDDRMDALKNCIKKLSDKERTYLDMRYRQGLSFRRIAAPIGLTSAGVFKALSQIHCKLMRCINKSLFFDTEL